LSHRSFLNVIIHPNFSVESFNGNIDILGLSVYFAEAIPVHVDLRVEEFGQTTEVVALVPQDQHLHADFVVLHAAQTLLGQRLTLTGHQLLRLRASLGLQFVELLHEAVELAVELSLLVALELGLQIGRETFVFDEHLVVALPDAHRKVGHLLEDGVNGRLPAVFVFEDAGQVNEVQVLHVAFEKHAHLVPVTLVDEGRTG